MVGPDLTVLRVAGMSAQALSLMKSLGIDEPVVRLIGYTFPGIAVLLGLPPVPTLVDSTNAASRDRFFPKTRDALRCPGTPSSAAIGPEILVVRPQIAGLRAIPRP